MFRDFTIAPEWPSCYLSIILINQNRPYSYNWYEKWPVRSGGHRSVDTSVQLGIPINTPSGEYMVDTPRLRNESGFTRGGIGFSFNISPDPPGRSYIRIHPDGNPPGTQGCLGLVVDGATLQKFYDDLSDYIKQHGQMRLKVIIKTDGSISTRR